MTAVDPAELYVGERRRLLGVAYRLLGSMSDAEDVLQDVFERWIGADRSTIDNPAAYLTTMTTRASLDRLRSARAQREVYTGPWLPEPVRTDDDGPAAMAELDESLTIGYLHLMEQLTPYERAAHLLHDVYEFSFREVAAMLDKDEAHCRQLASRGRSKLRALRPEPGHSETSNDDLAVCRRLVDAILSADIDEVKLVLTADVVHISDGGPDHRAARLPVVGPDRVARLFVNLAARMVDRAPGALEFGFELINERAALVVSHEGVPFQVFSIETDGDRVRRIYGIVNPDKLAAIT
ncbi:MAG: RNA polymerase sigma factor SigJ [Actinomycetota bacterium]